MYVCLCNGFRDCELRAIGKGGIRCAETAYAILGSHPKCGACLETAQSVLRESCGGANDQDGIKTEAA